MRKHCLNMLTVCRCICFGFPRFPGNAQMLATLSGQLLHYRSEMWMLFIYISLARAPDTWNILSVSWRAAAVLHCISQLWWWYAAPWLILQKWADMAKSTQWIQVIEELCFRLSLSNGKPGVFLRQEKVVWVI